MQTTPLATRGDLARVAVDLIKPLIPYMSPGRARIMPGHTSASYSDEAAQMEAFSRPLWAIVPMLAGGMPEVEPLWALWREGLENGVNPDHPEYWGDIGAYDQRMVEMAVMGVGLCIAPEHFLGDLSEAGQANLVRWLSQINDHDMPSNNWVFFRTLVNIGLLTNGYPHSETRMAEDLALIEARHDRDGYYFDSPTQRDYYSPWGFQYYGLFYARIMRERDPARSARYLARARQFAPHFAAWFAADGAAIPYGRSQTYRFAQGSFFAALAFGETDAPAMPWGMIKWHLLQNLRWWLARPIFEGDGVLSIGYGYPNLNMADSYNAPGSPYWGMKSFLALALPEDHPFWHAEETPGQTPAVLPAAAANMLIVRDEHRAHVQGFTAGNHAPSMLRSDAKYEKFVYSTAFAFSVSQGGRLLSQGAFDSMLALTDDGMGYRVRYGCESHEILEDRVISVWRPYRDVTVYTEIIPHGDWHIRRHRIVTPRPLQGAEGGFAIQRDQGKTLPVQQTDDDSAVVRAPWGVSGIRALSGYTGAEIVAPMPNTNLLHSRTLLPTLHADIPAGDTTLVCAVLGSVCHGDIKWATPPGEDG